MQASVPDQTPLFLYLLMVEAWLEFSLYVDRSMKRWNGGSAKPKLDIKKDSDTQI